MITINTYAELSEFVGAFGAGDLNMLIISSRGALGKSTQTQIALSGEDIVEIPGHVTPLGLYERLYNGRDKKVVFDEVDGLLSDTKHVVLLKQLGETRTPKKISWMSKDRRAQEIDGGAGFFFTTSPLLILCNSFTTFNSNVEALATRALVLHFAPSPREILEKLMTYAKDSEIIAFLERFHESLPDFSLRTYCKLADLKRAGLDWQKYGLQESNVPPKVLEIADLLERYNSDRIRLDHYSGCRRDYYNWKPDAVAYLHRHAATRINGPAVMNLGKV